MPRRQYNVTRAEARQAVDEWLHRKLGLSWAAARDLVRQGKVTLDGQICKNAKVRLQKGQILDVETASTAAPKKELPTAKVAKTLKVPKGIVVRHSDAAVVVVEKPHGLTTMRHAHEASEFGAKGKKYLPKTLEDFLPLLLPAERGKPARVIAVHRLDKETSGLVVFARTSEVARHLGKQLRSHEAGRRYLAIVRGEAQDARIESWLVRDRGDGRRGSGSKDEESQHAVTHVRVIERIGSFSLVECQLETGRTHQVRIHLGEAGTPLCGERIYDRPLNGKPLPDNSGIDRVALHAAELEFDHPLNGKRFKLMSRLPYDMKQLLDRLRSRQPAAQQQTGEATTKRHPDDAKAQQSDQPKSGDGDGEPVE